MYTVQSFNDHSYHHHIQCDHQLHGAAVHCVHDCGSIDFPQHWTKLDTTGGPRPPVRSSHAACCIAGPLTGQEHPLLLVAGGRGGALKDMWVLDVDRGVWREVSGLIVWCMMSYINSVCYKHVLLLKYMWLCALNLLYSQLQQDVPSERIYQMYIFMH